MEKYIFYFYSLTNVDEKLINIDKASTKKNQMYFDLSDSEFQDSFRQKISVRQQKF